MHNLIVISATYRQTSSAKADLVAHDPENRLLGAGTAVSGSRPSRCVTTPRDSRARWSRARRPSIKPYQHSRPVGRLAGGPGVPYRAKIRARALWPKPVRVSQADGPHPLHGDL